MDLDQFQREMSTFKPVDMACSTLDFVDFHIKPQTPISYTHVLYIRVVLKPFLSPSAQSVR